LRGCDLGGIYKHNKPSGREGKRKTEDCTKVNVSKKNETAKFHISLRWGLKETGGNISKFKSRRHCDPSRCKREVVAR